LSIEPGRYNSPRVSDETYDFAGKYAEQNAVTRRVLDRFFASVYELAHMTHARRWLEVGSGEGFSTDRLRKMLPLGGSLEASELEPRLVLATRKRNPSVPVTEESIYALGRATAGFDMVLAMEVLEHLEEPKRALTELLRVSREWLLLSVPREPLFRMANVCRGKYLRDLGNTPGHIQHWSQRSFVAMVGEQAEVVAVRAPLPWTVVLARKRPTEDSARSSV
jgi:2-polyprenyl-3-methyl-5-hydroxy-6-metoxy-1,4-benzoquinol methylase